MKYLRFLSIIFLFAFGCEKNNLVIEYSDPKETRFNLRVEQGVSYLDGTEQAWVYFSTTDFSEVPTLKIDGNPIPFWYLSFIGYSGESGAISPKTQYEFEIIKNTLKSNGIIEMPAPPINVQINGVLLTGVNDSIPFSTSYNITWECTKYDYFYFSSAGNTFDSLFNKSFELDNSSVIHGQVSFRIKTNLGKRNINDSNPNYLGDYGKGYIFSSVSKSFSARVVN